MRANDNYETIRILFHSLYRENVSANYINGFQTEWMCDDKIATPLATLHRASMAILYGSTSARTTKLRRNNDFISFFYFLGTHREGDRYVKAAWKDIKVGDLVHLSNNEMVPADLLLLRSSDPHGFAYLDTCNLDGETNLKQRQVVKGFLDLQNSFQPSKFRSIIEVDKPSTKIYRFVVVVSFFLSMEIYGVILYALMALFDV